MSPNSFAQNRQALLGAVIGGCLMLGGIYSVIFVEFNPLPPPPPEVIRPAKVARVVNADSMPERRFRGQVLAGRTVDLSFQVGGPLMETNNALGRRLSAGDVVAKIDPTRFEQRIASLRPGLEQARQRLERSQELVRNNAAPQKELDEAQAAYDAAVAELAIAEQSLRDTVMVAPFDALVVRAFVNNFQNVAPGEPIVRLQDIETLDIAVDLPEAVVALHQRSEGKPQMRAVFPVRPEPSYEVTYKEASAEADPQTGTYRVVFSLPEPKGLTVLPGMAVTLLLPGRVAGMRLSVPVSAIQAREDGTKAVWKLREVSGSQGVYETSSAEVTVEQIVGDRAMIGSGVAEGDLVVAAGVAFIREGQRVRPMESRQ